MTKISQQSGDKSAAALSLATRISEQLMPQMSQMEMGEQEQMPEEPIQTEEQPIQEEPEEKPEEKEMLETMERDEMMQDHMKEMDDKIVQMKEGLDSFKGEVKGIIETEIGNLTKTLKDAIK